MKRKNLQKKRPFSKECELRTPLFYYWTWGLRWISSKGRQDAVGSHRHCINLVALRHFKDEVNVWFSGMKMSVKAQKSFLHNIIKGKVIQRTTARSTKSFQCIFIAHSWTLTFLFWAARVNPLLNMNSLGRYPLPKNDSKGKLNQIIVFYERNALLYKTNTFSDLINIISEKQGGKIIFPEVDKPPGSFGIDDFSHLWFVISLGFSFWVPDQIRWLFKIVPSVIAAGAKKQVDDIMVIGHIRAARCANTHTDTQIVLLRDSKALFSRRR